MSIFNSLGSNYSNSFVVKAVIPGYGRVDGLSKYLSKRYDAEDVVLTYKGRQAILLALKRLNLPRRSKVAVNGYTCFAVYQAIAAADLVPKYIDLEIGDLNFSAPKLQQAIDEDSNISAVMIQNTLGFSCDIKAIEAVCRKANLPLIEDLAHSIGLIYFDGREAGTVGDAAALSFSQDKVIDSVSGGALLWHSKVKSPATLHRLGLFNRFRDWLYPGTTWLIRHTHRIGFGKLLQRIAKSVNIMSKPMDGRADIAQGMTSWHSRLALDAFNHLEKTIIHRRHIAEIYQEMLPKNIQFKSRKGDIFLRFPILVPNRNNLIKFLKQKHIFVSDVWYESPISPKRSIPHTNYRGQCPISEETAQGMLNLPTHVNVSKRQAVKIAQGVKEWLSQQEK